ncbi:MAG: chemotaxis protein CheY [Bacteroidetes bacterium]|nr:chemotaxis protein CheY [Bacteroidota bacterium]
MKESKVKVLLVDDDTLLGNGVVEELNNRGYETTYMSATYGVSEAIQQFSPDVLIFDVEIGKDNGIQVAQALFKGNPSLPIIFISSHHDDERKEAGLQAGAVAYIDKPFSVKLLSAHIDRFTRMTKKKPESSEQIMPIGNIQLDISNRALIFANGSIVDLRQMEFNILKELIAHYNDVVSRDQMCYAAWEGQSVYFNDQSLNNYIHRLRILLDKDTDLEIQLHRSMGYKLKETKK